MVSTITILFLAKHLFRVVKYPDLSREIPKKVKKKHCMLNLSALIAIELFLYFVVMASSTDILT